MSKAIDRANGRPQAQPALAAHIRARRQAAGVSVREMQSWFPHYREVVKNWERIDKHGARVPTLADWAVLRQRLAVSDEFLPLIERVEAEREVTGHNNRPPGWFTTGDGHDLTAPATPEAARWQGYGSALKPSWEPIVCARKPLSSTLAGNVLAWGTGALNIDQSRIPGAWTTWRRGDGSVNPSAGFADEYVGGEQRPEGVRNPEHPAGRWPPNCALIHGPGCRPVGVRKVRGATSVRRNGVTDDGTPGIYGEGVGIFPKGTPDHGYAGPDGTETVDAWDCQAYCPVRLLDEASGERPGAVSNGSKITTGMGGSDTFKIHQREQRPGRADTGGASRFMATFPPDGSTSRIFYTAKAPTAERVTVDGDSHATVKPLALMRWLVRLVVPPGGWVLDLFAGSGTTGEATMLEGEGRRSILVDLDMASCRKAWIRTDPHVRRRGNVSIRRGRPVEEGEDDAPRLF